MGDIVRDHAIMTYMAHICVAHTAMAYAVMVYIDAVLDLKR